MRLLLDTHLFLWSVTDSPRLSPEARKAIVSADEVYVSAASIWEAAIKAGLGKIHTGSSPEASQCRALCLRSCAPPIPCAA